MGIPGAANPLLLASQGGYQVSRSLRFNSSDSAYCSRAVSTVGDRKKWTWSGWVKRSKLSSAEAGLTLFSAGTGTTLNHHFGFAYDQFYVSAADGAGTYLLTTPVFRDTSAWYHIVVASDTAQTTPSDRIKIYINNTQITQFSTSTYPSLDYVLSINNNVTHKIGARERTVVDQFFDGYLAECIFVDGQQLTPSSFAETNATTGQWVPRQFSGSYGTNGFKLTFSDNSGTTATTLGKDTSPNGNNFTPTNFSVTAGAGNDSLVDTPTSFGTDDGLGGSVRGNYCTWNPLANGAGATSDGNLRLAGLGGAGYGRCNGTIAVSSGKWYYEVVLTTAQSNTSVGIGQQDYTGKYPGEDALSYAYVLELAKTINNNSQTPGTYGSALASGDIFMCAFDLDNNKIFFGKNGTWFDSGNPATGTNPAFTLTAGTYRPIARPYDSTAVINANFGQRPFAYTAPSGFRPLVDTCLPVPLVAKPSTAFDVKLWTGTGATNAITGLGFSPDLVWIKKRSAAADHNLVDSVRVGTRPYLLYPNLTNAENTSYTLGVQSLDSAGFTLGTDGDINGSGATYAGWCWDAGSSNTTNTSGTITSTVRTNGYLSIVTYTGNGTAASVGTGLNAPADFVILKNRLNATYGNWKVYHKDFTSTYNGELNTTIAPKSYGGGYVYSSASGLIQFATSLNYNEVNISGNSYVAYCFAPVAGYSSFGSYTGNGNTSGDGPFVFTGHLSRWLMIKRTDTAADWILFDTARDTYNQSGKGLRPNLSDAEYDDSVGVGTAYTSFDFLSNGFKVRGASARINASGGTYVYASFAQNPFQYARAR